MSEAPVQLVLDPCSGSRMFWFDREHPGVVFGDLRSEQHTLCDGRVLRIEPDVRMDFRAIPFPEGHFKLVVFDPPHLVHAGPKSWLAAKYGRLSANWREDLRRGFAECFRVLASDGVLVFKWNETQIRIREVLMLAPHRPLFGNTSGKKAGTHWMVFMKPGEPKAPLTVEALENAAAATEYHPEHPAAKRYDAALAAGRAALAQIEQPKPDDSLHLEDRAIYWHTKYLELLCQVNAATPQPLTGREIADLLRAECPEALSAAEAAAFYVGVVAAERRHGIAQL